jgi:hypothetical protein
VKVLALTITEREAIIRTLDDPPDGLAELRGVLLREHKWSVREGSCNYHGDIVFSLQNGDISKACRRKRSSSDSRAATSSTT